VNVVSSDDKNVYISCLLARDADGHRTVDNDALKEIVSEHGKDKKYTLFNLWEEIVRFVDISFVEENSDISFCIEDNSFRDMNHTLPRNMYHGKNPYYFLYLTISHGKTHVNQEITIPFCFLNGKSRPFRQKLWDKVEKDGLINQYCSFLRNGVFADIEFNIADSLKQPDMVTKIAFNPAEFYDRVLIDVYVEPEVNTLRFTEKTWKPLLHEKIAFGFSAQNYYRNLKWLGFKMHDNVIDYSFDSIEDNEERLEGFYEQFKKLLNIKLSDLVEITDTERMHNRKRCLTLIQNAEVPELPIFETKDFFELQKRDARGMIDWPRGKVYEWQGK